LTLKRNVKIVLYGVGVIGSMVARFLLEKRGVEIVGAIDVAEDKVGKDLGEVIGTDKRLGITVSDDTAVVLDKTKPDIAVHTTTSFMEKVYPQLAEIIKHGVNVVSTCEELSYPFRKYPELAAKLDAEAKTWGVALIGTGINPGFVMDWVPAVVASATKNPSSIHVVRSVDVSKRRRQLQTKTGVGLTKGPLWPRPGSHSRRVRSWLRSAKGDPKGIA
jgi:hypothetical protein